MWTKQAMAVQTTIGTSEPHSTRHTVIRSVPGGSTRWCHTSMWFLVTQCSVGLMGSSSR